MISHPREDPDSCSHPNADFAIYARVLGAIYIYSLIETAKANALEPFAYLRHVLRHIGAAETVEQLEALLPWRVGLTATAE